MITLEKALETVLRFVHETKAEHVEIDKSVNRILAEDIFSDINMPPFDKSAMDGFACRSEDTSNELIIVETIMAGKMPEKNIEKGQCSKIMTGAPVPKGADCIVMNEDVEVFEGKIKIRVSPLKTNICHIGEDIRKGDKVISKGTLIKPQHVAVLAMTGCVKPLVYQKPKISVIVTGDEIVEPWNVPGKSQIRNSNGYQIMAQLASARCEPLYGGIIRDDFAQMTQTITENFKQSNILIITGGASKGDFDMVSIVLKNMGFSVHFQELRIQPGKPVCFATKGDQVCFGLSGNPVSSFFQFELLVKPFLLMTSGLSDPQRKLKMKFEGTISRNNSEREQFIPVHITDEFTVKPVRFHGSAHINALILSDGIVSMKIGKTDLIKGEIADVRLI